MSSVSMPRLSVPSMSGISLPRFSAPPSLSVSGIRVPKLSAPSASGASMPGSFDLLSLFGCLLVPGLSALSPRLSAFPSPSAFGVRIPELSAPSASGALMLGSSTLPSPSGCLPVPGLSALPPGLSAPPSLSTSSVCMPGSFAPSPSGCLPVSESFPPGASPLFLICLSSQTPTPVSGKRRLDQWDKIIKRVTLEEARPTFAPFPPQIKRPSPPTLPVQ